MAIATSGMSGLDAQLGGGFPRGCTLLLVGDPSNAISLFAEQFSAGGVATNESVVHVQLDRPAEGCMGRIDALAKLIGNGKGPVRILDGYTPQFSRNGHGAKQGVEKLAGEDLLGPILEAAMKNGAGPYRVTVDSLSALLRRHREPDVVQFFRQLVFLGQETGGMHLVTLVKGLHDARLETELKHIASGVLEIGVERKGFGLYNYLQVTKLLDLRDPTRLLLFRETEKGLWLESTKRVF